MTAKKIRFIFVISFISFCSLSYGQNQKKLAKIAQSGKTTDERINALDQLEKESWQELFAELVKNEKNENIRLHAFKRLDSLVWEAFIIEHLENDHSLLLRQEALNRANPEKCQKLLATIVLNGNETENFREQSFKKLFDEEELKKVAIETRIEDYFKRSINRISNQDYLFDIFKKVENKSFKQLALSRISDEAILVEVLLNTEYDSLITEKIEQEQNCIRVYEESEYFQQKLNFLNKIKNQDFLAEIAKTGESYAFRKRAIINLEPENNQELFKEMALNDPDAVVRIEAIRKMDETKYQEIFKKIVRNDPVDEVKQEAFKKINDHAYIKAVILKRTKYLVSIALSKISDPDILLNYATNTNYSPQERCIAISRLNNQQIISNIAKNDKNEEVRYCAVMCLDIYKNQLLLLDIGLFEKKDYIRDEALKKLFPEDWQIISARVNEIRVFAPMEGRPVNVDLNALKKELASKINN